MLIYTNTKPSKKANRKTRREIEEYEAWLRSVNPSGQKPKKGFVATPAPKVYRRDTGASRIPSVDSGTTGALAVKSIMDPFNLQKQPPEVREEIIAKSKRVAIAYNKGGYQYITDDTDPKTLGSSERRR
jgi:hypothetical protein